MKTCPVCQRPYADDTMIYCLADGSKLVNVSRRLDLDATWRLTPEKVEPPPTQVAPTVPSRPTEETTPQSAIQYRSELQGVQPNIVNSVPDHGRSVLPWIFAMVVVLAASGILVAVILTRSRNSQSFQIPTTTQQTAAPAGTETKTTDKQVNSTTANVNRSKSVNSQEPAPGGKFLIASNRRMRDTPTVTPDKKKVEQPKPTGGSFIPIKP